MKNEDLVYLFIRYIFLLAIALSNLFIIYYIATPLTVFLVYSLLSFFYDVTLIGNILILNGAVISLISACIAGSAYYLLLILNLTTPMSTITRIKSLAFMLISFLILNVLRIVLFSILVEKEFKYFDLAHELTWYIGSTLLLIVIWFGNVYLFKIRTVPVYSDIVSIVKVIKKKR